MKNSMSVVGFVYPIYIAISLLTFFFGIFSGEMEYFYISILLGGPFLFGLIIAAGTKSSLIVTFALAALVSGWLAPLCFFLDRNNFTYSGQSAILDFQFSVFTFIGFYVPIIAGYYIILAIALLPYLLRKRLFIFSSVDLKAGVDVMPSVIKSQNSTKSTIAKLVFIAAILAFGAVNFWMFENSIGITGINPPELPFKLSGILFYTARFIFPIILMFQMTKFRPTSIELLLLLAYACFASLTSVSKAVLIILYFPALIVIFIQKRFLVLGFSLVLIAFFYPVVSYARNLVYFYDSGIAIRNISSSLIDVFQASLSESTAADLFLAFSSSIQRIGGGQDVVLAAQYDNNLVAGPIFEFIRLYIFDFWDLASTAQNQMYSYSPNVLGFATGDGGFFAHMLLAGGSSVTMLIVVSLYQGIVLSIADTTYIRMLRDRVPRELIHLYVAFFCTLFFAFSIPLWFNIFIIVTSVGFRTRVFKSFFKRY